MLKKFKSYSMPIAMTLGILLHQYIGQLAVVIPYLLFVMLLLTYSKLSLRNLRFTRMHLWLILFQIFGSLGIFFAVNPFQPVLAQGLLIVVMAPTATAAPVIAGMLKGDVASLTAYSLISNFTVALLAPLFFSYIGYNELPFLSSFVEIARRVGFLLILPFAIALLINKYLPNTGKFIQSKSGFTFYIWTFSLAIVTARTVQFIVAQGSAHAWLEIAIAAGALLLCVIQFWLGRKIGRKMDDTVAGGQGLGQKNTVLAIWMAQAFLHPLASIGPGAYVLWQNSVNSWQIWRQHKQNVSKSQ